MGKSDETPYFRFDLICSTQGGIDNDCSIPVLCKMYFKVSMRYNSELKTSCGYYRLVESYRIFEGRICHRTILNVGFINDLKAEDLNKIQKQLTDKAQGKSDLFEENDKKITTYVDRFWQEMIEKTN